MHDHSYAIASPFGGFGNHFRWLLLLSKEFSLPMNETAPKIKFIEDHIYNPKKRNCFNWISIEKIFRFLLDKEILFSHHAELCNSYDKLLILTIKPEAAFKNYLKFNPGYIHSKEDFILFIENQNQKNTKITNSLIMDVSILYSEVLNKGIYTKATEYFEIEDVYDDANYIHGLWYNLHKHGEKDILKILDNWHHRSIMNTHAGKTIVIPEEEHYLKIKQMVIDEYQKKDA